jgi:hypothetical protein
VRAQRFRRELRGNLDSSHGGVFRDIANLVDLDAGFAGQRVLQLLSERRRLGVSAGECAHKTRQLRLRQGRCEMNAGDAGSNQQLREAAFARRGS